MTPSRRRILGLSLLTGVCALAPVVHLSQREPEPDYGFLRGAQPVERWSHFQSGEQHTHPSVARGYRYLKPGSFAEVMAACERELRPPVWHQWSLKPNRRVTFVSNLNARGRAGSYRSTTIHLEVRSLSGRPAVEILVMPPYRKVAGIEEFVREGLAKVSGR